MREREEEFHDLDCGDIDELDELGAGEQLALVWCDTHEEYEWHWIPLCEVNRRHF